MTRIIIPLFAAILWPIFLASTTSRTILSPFKPSMISALDVASLARVLYCECRSETLEGQIFVADVLRNRAEKDGVSITESSYIGLCRGRLEKRFVELASEVLKQPPSHPYCYFLNESIATDLKWVSYSKTQLRVRIGSHWFF